MGRLNSILRRAIKKSWTISIFSFALFLLVAIVIAYLTRIDYLLVAVTGVMIFAVFLGPISRGMLQGKHRFKALGVNMVLEAVIKLALAIFLVFIGWNVYGAIIGTVVGSLTAIGLSFISLQDVLKTPEKKASTKNIYKYAAPSFFFVFGILAFFSLDVFLARIFFSSELAGAYSIASVLAKIIFLGTRPISRAMFPISSTDNKNSKNIFGNALVFLALSIGGLLVIFYFFSDFIVYLFSGKEIPEAAGILFYLAIGTSLLSLTNIVLFWKLSLNKTKNSYLVFIFVIIEVAALSFFSDSLLQFSMAFVAASAAFLWGSIILFE